MIGNTKGGASSGSGICVWAMAFGCMIGATCFRMPGTTFLPEAGPVGSMLGILLAGAISLLICVNYAALSRKYPEDNTAYQYIKRTLGMDHSFLAVWSLLPAYLSIIWSNAMAVSQFCRLLPGRLFRLGFHYSIAGSEIYLGESLLFLLVLSVCALVLLRSGRLFYRVFAVCSGVLLLSVCTLFLLVLIRSGRTNILSVPIPFLGGTVTSWAVDMTCLCTAVVYMYLSICAFQTTPRNCRFGRTCGLAGTVLALAVFLVLIIPDVLSSGQLAPGDYLVLMLWSLAGMLYYHGALVRDRETGSGNP